MSFGKELKRMRLKHARIGIRKFASLMDMKPSTLCSIENGYMPPPDDDEWLYKATSVLGLERTLQEMVLYRFWCKPFVMELMNEDCFITHATDIHGESLDEDGLIKLSKFISDHAKEHNIKAEKFNNGE